MDFQSNLRIQPGTALVAEAWLNSQDIHHVDDITEDVQGNPHEEDAIVGHFFPKADPQWNRHGIVGHRQGNDAKPNEIVGTWMDDEDKN